MNPEIKERERTFTWHWRNNKEKERLEGNEEQMKRQMEVIRELNLTSCSHLRCYDFFKVYEFLAFTLDNSGCFYWWLSRGLS